MSSQRSSGSGRTPRQSSSTDRKRTSAQGGRTGQGAQRSGASGSPNAGRRSRNGSVRRSHKRKRYNWPVIITYGAILLLVIVGVSFGISRYFAKGKTADSQSGASGQTTELAEVKKKVTVEGVSISGMTKEEAKKAVLDKFDWSLKAMYGDSEYEVANLLEGPLDAVLETIFDGGSDSSYSLDLSGLDEAIAAEVENMAQAWDVPAKDAAISQYDAENNKFLFSKEESGRVINREKLAEDLKAAVDAKDYDTLITVEGVDSLPSLTEAQAREQYRIIGTFETKTTSNKDRNTNIRLAAEALNGMIIPKGGVFSINECTGERTYDKGYRPAGAYVNGILVEEPGGGVCQVSSTLYNAVIFAGLNTTERYAHSYEPSYVNPGEDAMISFPNLDMKFENNTRDSVGILASFANQTLKISIYGIPVLEEGVTLEMKSELTETLPLDPPTYEEDPTLQPGEEVVAKAGTAGTKYVTYLITKKNGEVIDKIVLHNSRYKGKAPVIRRNSTGIAPESTAGEGSEVETSASIQDGTLDTVINGPGATKPENTETTEAPTPQTPSSQAPVTQAPETTPVTEGETTQAAPQPTPQTQQQPDGPQSPAQNQAPGAENGSSPKSPLSVEPRG